MRYGNCYDSVNGSIDWSDFWREEQQEQDEYDIQNMMMVYDTKDAYSWRGQR